MGHSRNWCSNRKMSVPSSARADDICPQCGEPFETFEAVTDDAVSPAIDPFEVTPVEPVAEISAPAAPSRESFPTQPEPVVTTTSTPRAGWYPDPSGVVGRQRYWDGGSWTQRTRTDVPAHEFAPPRGWDWRALLFSFQGRIHRAHYWAGSLVVIVAFFVMLAVVGILTESDGDSAVAGLMALVFFVLYFWIALALATKRWHDRGKSGAWMLILLIPFGGFWAFIELGLLQGTRGPNRFGTDPRGQESTDTPQIGV